MYRVPVGVRRLVCMYKYGLENISVTLEDWVHNCIGTHSATILIDTGIRLSWSIDLAVDILRPYPLAYYRVIIWSLRTPYPVDINILQSSDWRWSGIYEPSQRICISRRVLLYLHESLQDPTITHPPHIHLLCWSDWRQWNVISDVVQTQNVSSTHWSGDLYCTLFRLLSAMQAE